MLRHNIKQQLYNECKLFLNERIITLHKIIADLQYSLQSETKSSAGDKHETGRAMLQLELEKTGNQFSSIQKQQELLSKINLNNSSDVVKLGSLIETNNGIYFLAISKGVIEINKVNYFVIGPQSPIGKLLLGKSINDFFFFNSKKIIINTIN